ncbi:hypothetical protein [Streptomyces malaysiensis]|uniref:hypothetical protein n=1 Tax=Streptomyces malaysiensis TaxID=92644 RepID=UPI00142F1DEB|nr:hypothetical protein [Streptomyces malaysiensis]
MTGPTETEETRLRRALALIGEEAARPDPATAPAPSPRAEAEASQPRPRRRTRTVLALAAAACAAAAIATTIAVTADGDSGSTSKAMGRGQTFPEALACATSIVESDFTSVRPAGQGRVRVTMSVSQWYKPGQCVFLIPGTEVDSSGRRNT